MDQVRLAVRHSQRIVSGREDRAVRRDWPSWMESASAAIAPVDVETGTSGRKGGKRTAPTRCSRVDEIEQSSAGVTQVGDWSAPAGKEAARHGLRTEREIVGDGGGGGGGTVQRRSRNGLTPSSAAGPNPRR